MEETAEAEERSRREQPTGPQHQRLPAPVEREATPRTRGCDEQAHHGQGQQPARLAAQRLAEQAQRAWVADPRRHRRDNLQVDRQVQEVQPSQVRGQRLGHAPQPVIAQDQAELRVGAAVADKGARARRRQIDRDRPRERDDEQDQQGQRQVPDPREPASGRGQQVHRSRG